eukprot:1335312-Pyramimonas_sp.AAC.1
MASLSENNSTVVAPDLVQEDAREAEDEAARHLLGEAASAAGSRSAAVTIERGLKSPLRGTGSPLPLQVDCDWNAVALEQARPAEQVAPRPRGPAGQ